VHGVIEHAQLPAEGFDDALQAQADSEERDAQPDSRQYQSRNSEIGWTSRPGRNQNEMRSYLPDGILGKARAVRHHFRSVCRT